MKTFSKVFIASLLISAPMLSLAKSNGIIKLEPVNVNIKNMQSIERGAKLYATNCMVCHAMKYLEHDKIAESAGITIDKMPVKDQDWWFGTAPPDLSLTARVHKPNWLYTYFHSFYKDPKHRLGSNNLLVHNSSMPNAFLALQGEQVLTVNINKLRHHQLEKTPHYYNVLKLERKGSMTPEQFDQAATDLTNFFVYAGEPIKAERESLGYYVIGFFFIIFVLGWLLKHEYWKDVK